MSHPDFRLGGKVFASLGAPAEGWAMVKLTVEQQAEYLAESKAFRPCNGAWGRQGATNIFLADADKGVVERALAAAVRNMAEKKKAKRSPSKGKL